ncbi:MAG TPA: AAA family ATPase [Puia sp.]|nr:AAA family ATPase [Puia sp.]
MDFLYLLRILLKRKWLIIGVGLLAAAIAWVLTMNQPKRYRSFSQFSTGFTIGDEVKMVGAQDVDIYTADVKFNNVIVTVTSPSVISLLSYNLIIHDLEDPQPFRGVSAKKMQTALYRRVDRDQALRTFKSKLETMSMLTSFKPEEKDLLEYLDLYGYDYNSLLKDLYVGRVQRTDYVEIDCITENPDLSAFMVNTLFPQFLRYYRGVRSNRSQESIDTLRSLMDKKKQDLDAKNNLLRTEGVVDVGEENQAKLETIMNLEGTLTGEQIKQNQRRNDLLKVNQRIAAAGGANRNKPVATTDNDQIVILRKAANQAYTDYVNSGYSDAKLKQKYEQLNQEYQNKVQAVQSDAASSATTGSEETLPGLMIQKGDLETDIRAGDQTIADLQTKIANLRGNLVKDAGKSAAVESLIKDEELANKEYLAAKQKYTDAIDITTSSVNNFRPIISGQPAIDPEPSKRVLIVGMAGASALIITILIIVLLTYLDSSIKTPVIFQKTVGLPMLSMVNFMNLRQKDLAEIITSRETTPDASYNKRHNQFRESLRKLRFEVENSGKKIFLFASTKKGEGKTTLIQALSYSLSMSKKRILIIDTNFCNNDLTIQLNADPILEKIHPGNNQSVVSQVKNAAKQIGSTIFAIGSEGGDYTPTEILPRENLLQHLRTLIGEYDYILLEGPPLNDFSDTKELVQYVDGVIAVFSAKHIIKQIDRQSMSFFTELNGKFCGAVLNMVDLEDVNAT